MIHSALMVPADKEKLLLKIPSLEAGIIMINLEDGVFDKTFALELLASTLPKIQSTKQIIVRTNEITQGGLQEIQALQHISNIDGFRIPKITSNEDVKKAIAQTDKQIHLSIETKEALNSISSLKVSPQVSTLYLGILDLFNSLGLPHSLIHLQNPTIDYILSKFLIDSLSFDFLPVSFIYQEYEDLDTFRAWCEKEKAMGFRAKGCISPKQVAIANEVFGYGNLIEKALEIKALFEAKQLEGISGFSDEKYGFIDEPIYKNAIATLKMNNLL